MTGFMDSATWETLNSPLGRFSASVRPLVQTCGRKSSSNGFYSIIKDLSHPSFLSQRGPQITFYGDRPRNMDYDL